jgi:glycosyltransferase involved in cell wall biosynthesis
MPRLPGRLRRPERAPLRLRTPAALLEHAREGPAPLDGAPGGPGPDGPLRVAVVVPPFRRGSGGHSTIAHLVRGLEARGHACSLWLEDDEGRHDDDEDLGELWARFFGPVAGPVHRSTGDRAWAGADVAVATGWQTVHRVLRLPGVRARAYLVQDHEPEFHPTSAERTWAEETYRLGLHCVCASPWLAGVVRARYRARASHFDLGVDHATYRPLPILRREDLVLLYARAVTPRRAVPLGMLALAELHRRRPGVELVLFGESRPIATDVPATQVGTLAPAALAELYNAATVGVVLSMTNPSLITTELLACATATVDLASPAMTETFGAGGPVALAPFDPVALADAVERLLDDPVERADRARAGLALVAERTWDRAAGQVEAGLREALTAAS